VTKLSKIIETTLIAASAVVLAPVVQAQETTINFMSSNESSCGPYAQQNAQVFGFWDDLGVKVNFLSSDTSIPYVAFLQNGQADIALMDAPQVLQAVGNNLPVKVVYEAVQHAPDGIVVIDESPIKSLADLKDTTIGLASDRDIITTAIALNSIGATLEGMNVKTVVVGDSGPVMAKSLIDGAVQAFAGGASDRAGIEAAGVKIRNITPVEVLHQPANNFTVWGPTLEEKRPMIQAFLKGWAMAQFAGLVDTKLTASACRTKVPEQFENIEVGLRQINNSVYVTQLSRTKKYGELQPDVWADIQPPLIEMKELSKAVDPASFLDPSFIDGADDFTTAEVKKKIYEWKKANPDKLID
jgi:NitT/TauT family transport system substrate-binding protein